MLEGELRVCCVRFVVERGYGWRSGEGNVENISLAENGGSIPGIETRNKQVKIGIDFVKTPMRQNTPPEFQVKKTLAVIETTIPSISHVSPLSLSGSMSIPYFVTRLYAPSLSRMRML